VVYSFQILDGLISAFRSAFLHASAKELLHVSTAAIARDEQRDTQRHGECAANKRGRSV